MIDTNKNFIFNMEELKLAQFPLDELFSFKLIIIMLNMNSLLDFQALIKI